jgi:phosphatidylglycerophosphate synthase
MRTKAETDDREPVCAWIIGECPVRLWGLTSRERLRRQLGTAGVRRILGELEQPSGPGTVVLLRADHLFDDRTIRDLAGRPNVVLRADGNGGRAVAAHVGVELAGIARRVLSGESPSALPETRITTAAELSPSYVGQLLKSAPPAVLPIREESKATLERRLFDGSYKGVTDLVTKWVWPPPARAVTRLCARFGIRPNLVTAASLALAVAAAILFALGWYGSGLAVAWTMTFLDTVDGKLARVTVGSSTFGHLLDHGIDVIHPPFWYIAWGVGLPFYQPPLAGLGLEAVLAAIVAAYVAGRLLEAAFDFWLGKFSIFCWQPVDSYFRLVMARRNPNLLLLTASALGGRPDLGLIAVAAWTLGSSVFLAVRLTMAVRLRLAGERIQPWLDDPRASTELSWLARPFAERPRSKRG